MFATFGKYQTISSSIGRFICFQNELKFCLEKDTERLNQFGQYMVLHGTNILETRGPALTGLGTLKIRPGEVVSFRFFVIVKYVFYIPVDAFKVIQISDENR